MTRFCYRPQILAAFPAVVGGVIHGIGLQNPPAAPALQELYASEQQAVRERIGQTPLSELPSLAGWRAAFRRFDVDPTQYRSAAEALLRRLTRKGDIPGINTLVDAGNLVSIRYGLPVAIFDWRAVQGTVTVCYADGGEQFTELGSEQAVQPAPGEVIFVDEGRDVLARRWCWRQSSASAARPDTSEVVITVESLHESGREDVAQAVQDLLALLERFAGGTFASAMLGAERSAF